MGSSTVNNPRRVRAHLDALGTRRDLEEYCSRCGDCCRFAFRMQVGGRIERFIVPNLQCKHLRFGEDGLASCAVYADRHTLAPWCSPNTASQLASAVFSPRCGYIQGAEWLRPSQQIRAGQLDALAPGILGQVHRVEDTLDAESVLLFRSRWAGSD